MKRFLLLPAACFAFIACESGVTTSPSADAAYDPPTAAIVDAAILTINVQPKATNNVINLGTPSMIVVAIVGTPETAWTDFDLTSVWFGPDQAPRLHEFVLDGPTDHLKDVDGDGDDDLMFHFDKAATGLAVGDVPACLGIVIAGTEYAGCEDVTVIDKKVH